MKRLLLTGFVLFSVICPIGMTHAQEQGDPESVASDACWEAVVKEAQGRFAADAAELQGEMSIWQESNAETGVKGNGRTISAEGRTGTRFSFKCTYNIRSGDTYSIELRKK